jgi:phage/conjugal plasmid C-4 type zinc finger TraR family protein
MDDADAAQRREEYARNAAVEAARRSAAKILAGNGTDFCTDCDSFISVERRKAMPSATRCIDCQEIHEAEERTLRMRGK